MRFYRDTRGCTGLSVNRIDVLGLKVPKIYRSRFAEPSQKKKDYSPKLLNPKPGGVRQSAYLWKTSKGFWNICGSQRMIIGLISLGFRA